METELLYALRDPAGVPTHPVVFLVLAVVTFALHIFAVHVMLGSAGLTLWGAFSRDARRRRLARVMLDTAKIAVSVAIVLGVAPLLFVQVIYDPFWYTSNVLSARWAMAFIAILIIAYWLLYWFYFRNARIARGGGPDPEDFSGRWAMALSLALLLKVGFIMHVLTSQMLAPDQWLEWYAPGGAIDPGGAGLHAYNPGRYLFFISLALPMTGAWLMAYRRYAGARPGADRDYLQWVGETGSRLLAGGALVALVPGALWMATLPESATGFALSPWVIGATLALVTLALWGRWARPRAGALGYWAVAAALATGGVIAIAREALRHHILYGAHGYDFMTYPVNLDLYSTALFFLTFVGVGGTVLAYFLAVAWGAGQTQGVYTPGPVVRRLGQASVALIALWIVQYFAVGLWVWVR